MLLNYLGFSNKYATLVVLRSVSKMKTNELIRLLKADGCEFVSQGMKHDNWYSPITRAMFRVPRHQSKEIPKGT